MRETRIIMGMPVIIEIVDLGINQKIMDEVFAYFVYIDEKFSVYKKTSEISAINRGEIETANYSEDMKTVFILSEETKQLTKHYFDIKKSDGSYDPSGLVKGWAIFKAAEILWAKGINNFYISVAGDIQVSGLNGQGERWKIGIQNPFNKKQELIKVIYLDEGGVATSGTYVRGSHIYNPTKNTSTMDEIISLTVIGKNVYEADRFATAAFAMGRDGINFIENLPGFEGYLIDKTGIATITSGFAKYIN